MRKLLQICEKHSVDNFYRFNCSQTKILSRNLNHKFELYQEIIEVVETFKYLGIDFIISGVDWIAFETKRLAKAERIAYASQLSDHRIHMKARVTLYRNFVRPVLEYGMLLLPKNHDSTLTKFNKLCETSGRYQK
jgi:hypothetical protein